VNLLHVGGRVAVPKPFGPSIDGTDPFESDLSTRLGALGLGVHFVDNWDLYHIEMGEVHCGTNVERSVDVAWWESGR
jgi:protein-arginine deiminase